LRDEHRLRAFENTVLRIFGPKRELDGSWRKLHNDELHSLYSSPHIVRMIKSRRLGWAGHVAHMGEGRSVYSKRPLGRPRRRWEDLIRVDLKKIVCVSMSWIYLALDRGQWPALVNTIMNLYVL
jgi:hypothetical protein